MHIHLKELIITKIPAFQGKAASNNRLILKTLAIEGPLIKYDIYKVLKPVGVKHYPTISRRVDDLRGRGYLETAGTRQIRVGKRIEESSTYDLTLRGIVACLAIEDVRKNVFAFLERSPLLERLLPKSSYEQIILDVVNELFNQNELETISRALLEGFLRAIPENIELLKEEEYIAYIIPAIIKSPKIWDRLAPKDLSKLFQIEGLPEWLFRIIDDFEAQLTQTLRAIQPIKTQLYEYMKSTKRIKLVED